MDTSRKLDHVDIQMLRTLQENARLTVKELAAKVRLSSTPVFERLKRLEEGGYIKNIWRYWTRENLTGDSWCSVM